MFDLNQSFFLLIPFKSPTRLDNLIFFNNKIIRYIIYKNVISNLNN